MLSLQQVAPEALHTILPVSTIGQIRFKDEKAMQRYRSNIYSINKNNAAGRRYRTEREHKSSLVLFVWRMS